jgi:uncharacterized protein YjbI with pentapeptide repeats
MLISRLLTILAALLLLTSALSPLAGAAGIIDLNGTCIGCDMSGRDLHARDLHDTHFIGTDMHGVNLRGADLRDVKWVGVDLTGAQLEGADLRGAMFTGADFSGAHLAGARVDGVRLIGAQLTNIDFSHVDTDAFLGHCTGCDLHGADLHAMDLHGTALNGSNFEAADLERTNLSGAWLCSSDNSERCVNLRDARVTGADLRRVRWCDQGGAACRPAGAGELRTYTHNALNGAQLS